MGKEIAEIADIAQIGKQNLKTDPRPKSTV